MDQSTFNSFRAIVYDKSGISLADNKIALVKARLGKRMRALGIEDHREYLQYVKQDNKGEEIIKLLDVISTNVTSFFREAVHFEVLSKVVSEWLAQGQKRFRFWSAAASTGEEPYSLAMTLLETFNGQRVDAKILATDISTKVLSQCQQGNYQQEKFESVPAPLKNRYFAPCRDGATFSYTANAEMKNMIVFKRLNLSKPPFPMHGPLDVVFCRNVMIYFDNKVRMNLLNEISRLLKPGGYLMVGHAESLAGMLSELKTFKPSIYIRQ